jgi:hypothetical protein
MSEEKHDGEGIGIASAVLLAAATVGSAWCAYQATLWGGEQIRSLAGANTAHFESLRKTASANVSVLIDVSTFLSYMQNKARGDDKLAEFIRTHARKEFRPILEAWIAEQKPGVEPTDLPFKPPRYQVTDTRAAEVLEQQAAQGIERSNNANANGDLFVLHTVMFALALFFLGATSAARRLALRRIMLGLGGLVFTLSMISMARLPRAPSESRQKHQSALEQEQPHQ